MGYALIVALLSLVGAAAPLWFQPRHARLQVYLSAAAGTLLGAALFHLLPESSECIGDRFGVPAALGIVIVFLLQRYVAPHSHESSRVAEDAPKPCPHDHPAGEMDYHLQGRGPFLRGLIAILALSIHSFFDGVAIGAATGAAGTGQSALGFSVFLSVLIHKPMDGLSVSVLLLNAETRPRTLWLIQVVYAGLVPLGAGAFLLTGGAISEMLDVPFMGYTLAFSAGTFCSIALTDLLPELHFHKHDRNLLSAAMLAGLAVMLLTRWLGG